MESRFVYRGNACAAGGMFTHVLEDKCARILPVQASVSVPVTGGAGRSSYRGYKFRAGKLDLFMTSGLKAEVTAKVDAKTNLFTTRTFAEASRVQVYGGFRVDYVKGELESESEGREEQPPIRTGDCGISEIQLGKRVVKVSIDKETFRKAATKSELERLYAGDPEFRRANYWRFNAESVESKEIPSPKGIIVASIVNGLELVGEDDPDIKISGYEISWKGFGRIILGEILITDLYRRLTMVRLQLGSPIGGRAAIGEVETNGHIVP